MRPCWPTSLNALDQENGDTSNIAVQYNHTFAAGPADLASILKGGDVMVRLAAVNMVLEVMVEEDSFQTRQRLQAFLHLSMWDA